MAVEYEWANLLEILVVRVAGEERVQSEAEKVPGEERVQSEVEKVPGEAEKVQDKERVPSKEIVPDDEKNTGEKDKMGEQDYRMVLCKVVLVVLNKPVRRKLNWTASKKVASASPWSNSSRYTVLFRQLLRSLSVRCCPIPSQSEKIRA
jgi:hypothetical protein